MKKLKLYAKFVFPKYIGEKSFNTSIMLNAEKIDGLSSYIPTEEMIQLHLAAERIKVEQDKDYKPFPLMIKVKEEDYNKAMKDIKTKCKVDCVFIPLVAQTDALPVCILASEVFYDKISNKNNKGEEK